MPPAALLAHNAVAERVDSYVRLADWCRSRGLALKRASGENAYIAGTPRFQFYLRVDSREARANDIGLCLSSPVIMQSGAPMISELDVKTALDPLLGVNNKEPGRKAVRITLDPGHGGKDPGFQVGTRKEKDYTLLLAQELKRQLDQAGFQTSLTRRGDTFIPLPQRPEIARQNSADIFISLHWNSLPTDRSVRGAQTFCMTPAGASSSNGGGTIGRTQSAGNINNRRNIQLACNIQKSLVRYAGAEDRGVRRARYWVLRDATMPAVLIEGGFMSNAAEARRIFDAGYRKKMAGAIVQGVLAYREQSR